MIWRMADIAMFSRTRLLAGLRAARGRLASIREAAEVGAQRLTIGVAAAGGGFTVGFVEGRAERDVKDITMGDSEVSWALPISGATMLIGAFGSKLVGETTANVVFGLGAGGLAGELALMGRKKGLKPSAA